MSSSTSMCTICKSNSDETDPLHNNTPEHVFNFYLFQWEHYRKALVKNRHGVILEINPVQSNVKYAFEEKKGQHMIKVTPEEFSSYGYKLSFSCTIKNCRRDEIFLTSAFIQHPYNWFSLRDPENYIRNGKILKILSGSNFKVFVEFDSGNQAVLGSYKIPVAFNFQVGQEDCFTIARSVIVSIEKEVNEVEKGTSPFTNNEWPNKIELCYPTQKLKYYDKYTIPKKYMKCIKYGLTEFQGITPEEYQVLLYLRKQITSKGLTAENYKLFWHILLWMEEMAQSLMLRRYNMENVRLKVLTESILELKVPGLAERRPSVISKDMVDIKVHNEIHKCYRGIINKVNDETVEIAYLDKEILDRITSCPDTEVDVRFVLSRLNLERMHQGVDQVVLKQQAQYLFPDVRLLMIPRTLTKVPIERFYNPLVAQNPEQKTAVLNIVSNSSGSIPYIVFGPPGTGKTITIVEAILQLKDCRSYNSILVCAPANAACDMLAEKLAEHCEKHELIRVLSETVDMTTIPPCVLEYSNYEKDGRYKKITAKILQTYKIVVTTLGLIGRYQDKYQPDIVFVDEAAQACEPEADCAIGVLRGNNIILAGDPKQLGPFSSSKVAEQYGFGRSLLERLMDLKVYQGKDEKFITMLKLNFRSHKTILQIPNQLFYNGQLKAVSLTAHNDPVNKHLIYPITQTKFTNEPLQEGQAIEYCNVISEERREGRSPSYYNDQEAATVLEYIRALINKLCIFPKVSQEDIGVVTPYIRQVYKIKNLLKNNNFGKVEVGTTETFQGREKRVIIISTVRSRQDLLLYDRKYNLGFVRNDMRFNVALTRAKSKLIIIGSAHTLATDTKWLKFIKQCESLGVTCGAPLTIRTDEMKNEITKRYKRIEMIDMQKIKKKIQK